MKNIKKIVVLSTLMGACFSAGVYASNGIEKVEAYLRSDFKVVVKGTAVDMKEPPLVYNGKSYLPLTTIGELLGAQIAWDGNTQTIYVNPRIYANQPKTDDKIYEEIELTDPFVYAVKYAGRDDYILTNNYEDVTYYRQMDLQRMGVNTDALKKAKEKITGALYVRKTEAEKMFTEPLKTEYPADTPVTGETDSKKLEVLRNFSPGYEQLTPYPRDSQEYKDYISDNANKYIPKPRRGSVYIIDALPEENEYEMLYFERKYYRYKVKLASITDDRFENGIKRTEVLWFFSYYHADDLQPEINIQP